MDWFLYDNGLRLESVKLDRMIFIIFISDVYRVSADVYRVSDLKMFTDGFCIRICMHWKCNGSFIVFQKKLLKYFASISLHRTTATSNYMFKDNNRNTSTRYEKCSKLTMASLLLTLNIFHTLF